MSTCTARGPVASLHERALLLAAQRNDWRAQEEVLRRYEPLVCATVARLRLPARIDRDDLAQEARVGLLAAIRGWEPDRGSFPALAARCVRNQAMKALDAACAQKHRPLSCARSLDAPALLWAGNPQDGARALDADVPPSRLGDPEASVVARQQLAAVCAALSVLSEKERAVFTGVLNGCSHRQLAEELGGTEKAVGLALRRARDKLADCEVLTAA